MAKKWRGECRCMSTFKSWVYISDIPRPNGSPNHLWQCAICGRKHVTPDKVKPSEAQQRRILR